jgi:hypothetical protein
MDWTMKLMLGKGGRGKRGSRVNRLWGQGSKTCGPQNLDTPGKQGFSQRCFTLRHRGGDPGLRTRTSVAGE